MGVSPVHHPSLETLRFSMNSTIQRAWGYPMTLETLKLVDINGIKWDFHG